MERFMRLAEFYIWYENPVGYQWHHKARLSYTGSDSPWANTCAPPRWLKATSSDPSRSLNNAVLEETETLDLWGCAHTSQCYIHLSGQVLWYIICKFCTCQVNIIMFTWQMIFTSLTAEPQQSYTLRFRTSSAGLGRKIEIYPEIFSEAHGFSATVFLVYKTMHVGLQWIIK